MLETYTPANPVGVLHSREAEEAVLGSILVAPELFSSLGLEKSHFYIQRLGMIWEACSRLDSRKSPLDFLTIAEELDDMGRLDEIGGPAYLTALLNQVPTTLHAQGYAALIKADATRRELLRAANEMARLAYDTSLDANDMLAQADAAIRKVGQGASPTSSWRAGATP